MKLNRDMIYTLYSLIMHAMMSGIGILNYKQIENTEPTFDNYFLLHSLTHTTIFYFVSDMCFNVVNFSRRNIQYIVHHIVFLSATTATILTKNIQFVRATIGIAMFTEISGILLDIDALYKLYLNPDAITAHYAENKTLMSKVIKVVFIGTFFVVRYIIAPFLVIKYYMAHTLTKYERSVFFTSMTLYTAMHGFWFYKITGYVRKFLQLERGAKKEIEQDAT